MTENMPTLYRNIMDGLPTELAQDAFLWAVERSEEDRYCYRAEDFAREVDAPFQVQTDKTAWQITEEGRKAIEACPEEYPGDPVYGGGE